MIRDHWTDKLLLDTVQIGDSRELAKSLPDECVDVTVTSPPYFDMKDYGRKNQIGYGQDYAKYLADLASVFAEISRATKRDGSLWIIIDTFRRDQEVVPLPFDLANKLRDVGWTLRDVIIWKKDRTVPWQKPGSTRKIFEYILVFARSSGTFRYDHDKFRDSSDLKKWWVRYPERYNPRGKSPEEIWTYGIPTQGSWGSHYVRHFCPLPTDLVSRIIQLTTDRGDVVLDPFAGSGTVPTVSKLLDRHYVGFELNSDYVAMFQRHLKKELARAGQLSLLPSNPEVSQDKFATLIRKLRITKFGRLVLRNLNSQFPKLGCSVFVYEDPTAPDEKFKLYRAQYLITTVQLSDTTRLLDFIDSVAGKAPLSKFGVQASFKIARRLADFKDHRRKTHYVYSATNSHAYAASGNLDELWNAPGQLISPIKLQVEEPDG